MHCLQLAAWSREKEGEPAITASQQAPQSYTASARPRSQMRPPSKDRGDSRNSDHAHGHGAQHMELRTTSKWSWATSHRKHARALFACPALALSAAASSPWIPFFSWLSDTTGQARRLKLALTEQALTKEGKNLPPGTCRSFLVSPSKVLPQPYSLPPPRQCAVFGPSASSPGNGAFLLNTPSPDFCMYTLSFPTCGG